jgi:hypothetical protein
VYVGRHGGEPVTDDYPGEPHYRFAGGTINRVAIDVSGEPYMDLEREAALMLMRNEVYQLIAGGWLRHEVCSSQLQERDRGPRTSIGRGREMKLSARDLLRQCPAACPPSICSVSPVTNVASSR